MATRKHRRRRPDYWRKAQAHLVKADPVLGRVIRRYRGETLSTRGDAFFSLTRAIVGQQISVRAAESVWAKLTAALGGEVLPARVLSQEDATLRACGLSGQKVLYLKELSQFFTHRTRHNWHRKSDAEVIEDLISIKGIGKWSAEMFLMFHLLRPDVFPIGDLGLRKGIEKLYNKGKPLPLTKIVKVGERWRPYRTVATWYLWRSLDPAAIEY